MGLYEKKVLVLFSTFIFTAVSLFFMTVCFFHSDVKIGERAVRIMYEFDDLEQLNNQYSKLENILDESLWDEFSLSNNHRIISNYMKFKTSSSRVHIVSSDSNRIVYTLENDYIDSDDRYIFEYEVVRGKIVSAREYVEAGRASNERD